MNKITQHIEDSLENFWVKPEVLHTLKIVPGSQRELFQVEMSDHIIYYAEKLINLNWYHISEKKYYKMRIKENLINKIK